MMMDRPPGSPYASPECPDAESTTYALRSQATVEDQLVIRGLTNVPTGVYVVETGAGLVKTAPRDMFRQHLEPGMSPRTPSAQDDIAQCSTPLWNLLRRDVF